MIRPLILLGLVACAPDDLNEGTLVGNPSLVAMKTAANDHVTLDEGSLAISAIVLFHADGAFEQVDLVPPVDVLAGGVLEVPAGEWRAVTVEVEGPMWLSGTSTDGQPARATFDVPEVNLQAADGAIRFGEDSWVVELAFEGWLDPLFTQRGDGEALDVHEEDLLADRLSAAVRDASALFVDADGDGEVDGEEREAGADAAGRDREATRPER